MGVFTQVFTNAPNHIRDKLVLLLSKHEPSRIAAVDDLVSQGYQPVAEVFQERIVDETIEVADHMLKGLQTLNPDLAHEAAFSLCESRKEAWIELGKTFLSTSSNGSHEQVITTKRVKSVFDFHNVHDLLSRLKDDNPNLRKQAAERLAQISDDRIVPALLECLNDSSPEVIRVALAAILKFAPEQARKAGIKVLNRKQLVIRKIGAEFLAKMSESTVKDLLDTIKRCGGHIVKAAAGALALHRFDESISQCEEWLNEKYGTGRKHAVRIIGLLGKYDLDQPSQIIEQRRKRCISLVKPFLKDKVSDVRAMAIRAVTENGWSNWRTHAKRMLKDKDWEVRKNAVGCLGWGGDPNDLNLVLEMFKDEDEDVRKEALESAVDLTPKRKVEFATVMLTDKDEDVAKTALKILKKTLTEDQLVEIASEKLKKAKGKSGSLLLDLTLKAHSPEQQRKIIEIALASKSDDARVKAIELLAQYDSDSDVPLLKKALNNTSGEVRLAAFKGLSKAVPNEAKNLAATALKDKYWAVRLEALKNLAKNYDPLLVDELLPLARDGDVDVRTEAIRVLAKFDDMRVFSELVSSLNDVEEEVCEVAEKIFKSKPSKVPVLRRLQQTGDEKIWESLRKRIDEINRWASQIGQELLGKPVIVYNYRQGLGRTGSGNRRRVVEIEVTDTPMTSGHLYGEDIMRGLALHEIGHHLCDFGVRGSKTTRGIARSEGVGEIYDYLLDERLERVLRSRRPEWGVYFDRIASYAFAQDIYEVPIEQLAAMVNQSEEETIKAIQRGALPGQFLNIGKPGDKLKVKLREADMLAIPRAVPPHMAFLACLRCGFDPEIHPDSNVAKAIALIPDNLKDIPHSEILKTARKIGDLIGRSDKFKKDMVRLRQMMKEHREVMRVWKKAFDRMTETGHFPDWIKQDAPGIRENRPLIVQHPPRRKFSQGIPVKMLNLGKRQDYDMLVKEQVLPFDPDAHSQLVGTVRKHIRRLRLYFEHLGKNTVDEYASRRGRRLDLAQARKATFVNHPNLLIHSREEILPDAYVGILIDCSGSMSGKKLELAKSFGALVAESAKGLRGLEGHINGFDDDTFYWLGNFRRNAVATLRSGGGNNDAGALAKAAELALRSRKRNKLLVMISDGCPTECTFDSLKNLVQKLSSNHGIVCAQAAVEKLDKIAFPHYVDLSKYSMDEAITRFGNLLMQLTTSWR